MKNVNKQVYYCYTKLFLSFNFYTVNIDRYNPHKQNLLGVFDNF